MEPKKAALLQIILSIVFAIAIVLSSIFLEDRENANTVTFIIIAIWWIPFSLLVGVSVKGKK